MTQANKPPDPDINKLTAWERAMLDLPPSTRQALQRRTEPESPPLDHDELSYQFAVQDLTSGAREYLDQQVPEPESEHKSVKPRWCVCESPEGDFLKIRIFSKLQALVDYLADLEGRELAVWSFLGVPLRMTIRDPKTGQRFLALPGGKEAILLQKGNQEIIDLSLIVGEDQADKFQLDGWLGHPALAESSGEYLHGNKEVRQKREKKAKEGKKKKGDEGEEEKGNPVK